MSESVKPTQHEQDTLLDWHTTALQTDPGYKSAWEKAQVWPESLRPFVVLRIYSTHNHQLRALLRTM